MFQFDYIRPAAVDEACAALADGGKASRVIAGGTDLMVQIHEKDKRWKDLDQVVDITGLAGELRYVRDEGERIAIGALATHTDLECSQVIRQYLPCLSQACATVGSTQIRNRGTIGGSIWRTPRWRSRGPAAAGSCPWPVSTGTRARWIWLPASWSGASGSPSSPRAPARPL